jgi:EAL domain-containing protein (putative c-di-GMP-specific phosphodiesterase class I)
MSKKIIKLAVLVPAALGALALVGVLLFNAVRHFIVEHNEALVHSVALSILPALLVNDTQQVNAVLKALENYPGIESAELVSAQGASIASYARSGHALDPMSASFELASANDDPNQMHVMAPITFDSLIVANLHIAVNLWPTYLRIITWLGILLIVPSVIYVLVKQLRIKVRFESVAADDDADRGRTSFDVAHALNVAMQDAGISLDYQPIQRMSDGGVFGMEVVVCWHHPSGQTLHVSPSDFVGMAEQNKICLSFDNWLWRSACTQAVAWQHQYGPLILAINITETQFKDPSFAQKIRDVCRDTQYPHQLLELEVDESVVVTAPEQAATHIKAFAEQGLSVTIDRFGLSAHSQTLLEILPVYKVKLDGKLVQRLNNDAQVKEWVDTTIQHALAHDVQIMADGLDFGWQHLALQGMGCILGQGTYFHAPMTAVAFEGVLSKRSFRVQAIRAPNFREAQSDSGGYSAS